MKLSRVRIEQFRQFRQPVTLTDLEAGINLFTGPNEAGKSTLVAAIRAAFFERHRSGSVDDFRPWGDSAATPTIEVDFTVGGVAHRLTKSFLGKKRCELQAGTQRFDGASAEDHLAQLLGFQHATRGASAAEHWGIPGLLWIQQGGAHQIDRSVAHATDHLRNALNESLGEVASHGGDDLLTQVEAQRNELLTPSAGAPRGAYADALKAEAALSAAMTATASEIAQYRDRVDTLAAWRAEQAADEADPPWAALRQQEAEARRQHETAQGVQAQLMQARRRAAELDAHVAVLKQQSAGFLQQQSDVASRAAQLTAARQALGGTAEAVQLWLRARTDALARGEATRQQLRSARQQETRLALARDLSAAQAKADEIGALLERAHGAQAALLAAQQQASASAWPADVLPMLRDQQRQIRELQIQQGAAATGLRFALDDGATLRIGDEDVSGRGERRLVDTTRLHLPGLGWVEITPGGTDLPALRHREQALADAHAAQLQRFGLQSLDDAEARQQAALRHAADEAMAAATLRAIAPKGLDALQAEHRTHMARTGELRRSLDALPASADTPLPSVAQAEAADDAARESLTEAEQQLVRAERLAASAQAAIDAAHREHAAAVALLEAPERAQRLADNHAAVTGAQAEQHSHAAHVASLETQLLHARPDILAQDVERFRRSADQHEKRFTERREALLRLDAELQAVGAQGLDERHAEQSRDLAQLQRRGAELRRRAQALDHLLQLLKDKRKALTRKLQAPLQRHLQHYLGLLFPEATLEIDDNLTPGPLTRPSARGPQAGHFDSLSFGAREQMGIIARLAYADLLKEAGRPTLIILDDALVHSDAQRLAQMKRVLFDAATRHQILLFTCHPTQWRDLGVPARSLQALQAGAHTA